MSRGMKPPNLLDVTGVNGLAQAAGIASFWIRKGIAERVEVLHRKRLVIAISRFDVRMLDEPRRRNTYQVRTLDRRHALIRLDHAAQLRDALVVVDERLLSRRACVPVEIRTGRSVVALLTREDLGRVWPGRGVRTCMGEGDARPADPS